MRPIGKLGRPRISRNDPRTLPLRAVVRSYPAPPMSVDYIKATRFSWFMNDQLGCCTITAIAHFLELCAAERGETISIPDSAIVTAYRAISGYDPDRPETDRGATMIDALIYARNVGIAGHKIGGFARVDVTDQLEVQAAVNLFGAMYTGSRLPKRIQSQGTEWSLPPPERQTSLDVPGSLGGHAYLYGGFNHRKSIAMPWVERTLILWPWHFRYTDEGWAIFDEAWVSGDRPAPNGFDLVALRTYLAAL